MQPGKHTHPVVTPMNCGPVFTKASVFVFLSSTVCGSLWNFGLHKTSCRLLVLPGRFACSCLCQVYIDMIVLQLSEAAHKCMTLSVGVKAFNCFRLI